MKPSDLLSSKLPFLGGNKVGTADTDSIYVGILHLFFRSVLEKMKSTNRFYQIYSHTIIISSAAYFINSNYMT